MTKVQKQYLFNLVQNILGDIAAFVAVVVFIGIALGLAALAVLAPLGFLLEATGR